MPRRLAALLLSAAVVVPAEAKVDAARLGAAHFVGLWSMDGPEGCSGGDTLSFFATGIWAVTNAGGNPVEALGTWTIGEGVLLLTETTVDRPLSFEETQAIVDSVQDGRMEITVLYRDGRKLSYALDRCP